MESMHRMMLNIMTRMMSGNYDRLMLNGDGNGDDNNAGGEDDDKDDDDNNDDIYDDEAPAV